MALFSAEATAEEVTCGLDLSGRTIVVTGCNSGLGFETMRVLALRGARVLGTARTQHKAEEACGRLDGDTVPIVCELAVPYSVSSAIAAIREPIDAIIANAGVMALPERTLIRGVEAHLYINHVGHFQLVTRLLDRLTADGRVVMVSSGAHAYAPKGIDLDDLAWRRPYKPWAAYGQSKLANILFAKELAKRLRAGQSANALHPGVIVTPLWRHLPEQTAARMMRNMRFRSIAQGAATQVFVATHPSVTVSGAYFGDCAVRQPNAAARNKGLARRLWERSEALIA